jgi:tetratricopeptide (TPR) repeat protein
MLLFAWAAVDQLHFFWSSEASSLPALERAARLNPDDSSVQVRLARAELLAGNRVASLLALQHASEISPGNFVQQEEYARGLIEAGRTADAYGQYRNILGRWPRNVDALVNSGLLAQRLGHGDEAVDDWERALDIDAMQSNAQLYLAQALEQRGEAQAAARHYRAYLQIVAAHRTEHGGEGSTVIAALIKVADADAAAKQANEATQGYRAAIAFAEKTNEKTLGSLALVHLADLQEKQGDIAGAAQSFQRALTLDASLDDPRNAASDWLNYGEFLRREHQPERFVFACMVRAEELMKTTPGDELSVIVNARAESEARLGRDAATVRRQSEAIAKEALSLPGSAFSSAP